MGREPAPIAYDRAVIIGICTAPPKNGGAFSRALLV